MERSIELKIHFLPYSALTKWPTGREFRFLIMLYNIKEKAPGIQILS